MVPNSFLESLLTNVFVVATNEFAVFVKLVSWLTNSNKTPPVTKVATLLKSKLFKTSLKDFKPSIASPAKNSINSLTMFKILPIVPSLSISNLFVSKSLRVFIAPVNFP